MDRRMSSFHRADSPRTAWIRGAAGRRIVLSFPIGLPYGMDRREVQHIESHRGDIGQARFAIFERAMPAGLGAARTREHLIPGTEAGLLSIHHYREFSIIHRFEAPIGVLSHQDPTFGIKRGADTVRFSAWYE